jgi:two-component system CitB family sensor kinase
VVLDIREEDGGIRLTIADSGPGIPAGCADEIFQDGFSTKMPRRGLRRGLGLALVRRLVQRLGGEIHAVNPADGGAAFMVILPPPDRSAAMDGELATTGVGP